MSETTAPARSSHRSALPFYRVMAYLTGTALVSASVMWFLVGVVGVDQLKTANGLLWVCHGFFFLVYAVSVLNLAFQLRWSLVRLGLVVLAGVVPVLTFVIEHYIVRRVRAESAPSRG